MAGYVTLMFLACRVSFMGANFIMGLLSGWVYQLTASRLMGAGFKVGRSAGIIESSDHWGSAAGALISSLVAGPIFGLFESLIVATAVLVAAIAVSVILPYSSSEKTMA